MCRVLLFTVCFVLFGLFIYPIFEVYFNKYLKSAYPEIYLARNQCGQHAELGNTNAAIGCLVSNFLDFVGALGK